VLISLAGSGRACLAVQRPRSQRNLCLLDADLTTVLISPFQRGRACLAVKRVAVVGCPALQPAAAAAAVQLRLWSAVDVARRGPLRAGGRGVRASAVTAVKRRMRAAVGRPRPRRSGAAVWRMNAWQICCMLQRMECQQKSRPTFAQGRLQHNTPWSCVAPGVGGAAPDGARHAASKLPSAHESVARVAAVLAMFSSVMSSSSIPMALRSAARAARHSMRAAAPPARAERRACAACAPAQAQVLAALRELLGRRAARHQCRLCPLRFLRGSAPLRLLPSRPGRRPAAAARPRQHSVHPPQRRLASHVDWRHGCAAAARDQTSRWRMHLRPALLRAGVARARQDGRGGLLQAGRHIDAGIGAQVLRQARHQALDGGLPRLLDRCRHWSAERALQRFTLMQVMQPSASQRLALAIS